MSGGKGGLQVSPAHQPPIPGGSRPPKYPPTQYTSSNPTWNHFLAAYFLKRTTKTSQKLIEWVLLSWNGTVKCQWWMNECQPWSKLTLKYPIDFVSDAIKYFSLKLWLKMSMWLRIEHWRNEHCSTFWQLDFQPRFNGVVTTDQKYIGAAGKNIFGKYLILKKN